MPHVEVSVILKLAEGYQPLWDAEITLILTQKKNVSQAQHLTYAAEDIPDTPVCFRSAQISQGTVQVWNDPSFILLPGRRAPEPFLSPPFVLWGRGSFQKPQV